jgi:hypothetical protein
MALWGSRVRASQAPPSFFGILESSRFKQGADVKGCPEFWAAAGVIHGLINFWLPFDDFDDRCQAFRRLLAAKTSLLKN